MSNTTQLSAGSELQGGKYRIEKVLGQGGFGITYEAEQVSLDRKVAIKEFFMKEYCNRDTDTSYVSVPSTGSKELVGKFKQKFVKEAKLIAGLDHPNIIKIHDVFEEHGTAYYVMEYLGGGSLSSYVESKGRLPESEAIGFIRQVGSALSYIHGMSINHLDVKPGNILLDGKGRAVLIDFGLSKRYDDSGNQTSSTPVGISHGYAPLEQYKAGGVGTFSPTTDVYSLGATLYKLVTGQTPPDANTIYDDGFPQWNIKISAPVKRTIEKAMQPRRKDRPQSIAEFLKILDGNFNAEVDDDITDFDEHNEDDSTHLDDDNQTNSKRDSDAQKKPNPVPAPKPSWLKWAVSSVAGLLIALGLFFFLRPEPVEPAKPATTKFYVTTTPSGATVTIDGKSLGKSPIKGIEVTKGSHSIKITKDGYESYAAKLSFGDEPVVVNESLKEKPAPSPPTTATRGTINGHEYVDLGLSVKWATCNVGASSPSDYGDYYAWGETNTKAEYTISNSITYGKSFRDISGNSTYDVARKKWGSSWRLPMKSEFEELKSKCTWEWTTQGGHSGYKVTGPNGNSTFLPAAGWRDGDSLNSAEEGGRYWSSSPVSSDSKNAFCLYFGTSGQNVYYIGYRYYGRTVRPVSE